LLLADDDASQIETKGIVGEPRTTAAKLRKKESLQDLVQETHRETLTADNHLIFLFQKPLFPSKKKSVVGIIAGRGILFFFSFPVEKVVGQKRHCQTPIDCLSMKRKCECEWK
jgi:hypothetical protein